MGWLGLLTFLLRPDAGSCPETHEVVPTPRLLIVVYNIPASIVIQPVSTRIPVSIVIVNITDF